MKEEYNFNGKEFGKDIGQLMRVVSREKLQIKKLNSEFVHDWKMETEDREVSKKYIVIWLGNSRS